VKRKIIPGRRMSSFWFRSGHFEQGDEQFKRESYKPRKEASTLRAVAVQK